MKVFAQNFRGFKFLEIDLNKINFLVGDNSSGKSSIIYLVDALARADLFEVPGMDEEFGVSRYDYFSPYFDYDDVTFGYASDDAEDPFIKILTVKRAHGRNPRATRCSYLNNGKLVSFRTRGRGIQRKFTDGIDVGDIGRAIDIHNDNKGYRNVDVIDQIPIGNPSMILSAFDDKRQELSKLARASFKNVLSSYRLVSPTRALPEKFYEFQRKFNADGRHFAAMWMDFSGLERDGTFGEVSKFGLNSGLFDSIIVRRVARNFDDSPLIVSVKKAGREFFLNQVGVGISQVVPVLMETEFALRMPDTHVLIQQPELHLHPVAQAALGSYFYSAAKGGVRGVLETHSSFLLDRFRAEIRDAAESQDDPGAGFDHSVVEILFCENNSEGNRAHAIRIDRSGQMIGEPDSFHEFFVSELVKTIF